MGTLAVLAAAMLVAALGFTILGQGGGVLYTPLQLFAGIGFHTAATTSLFLIMTTSLSATLVFRRSGRVDWPLALVLESVTMAGGFAGGVASGRFPGAFLMVLFAAVVALAAWFMVRNTVRERECAPGTGFFSWRRSAAGRDYCVNLAVALPASFLAGAVSGLVGVGGGILKVPMMVLLFGIPMEIAVGSSAFMIGLTAAAGFAGHVAAGHWDWRTSLLLAAVVFAGGQAGARISVRLDKRRLRRAFGWFLFGVAALMTAKALL